MHSILERSFKVKEYILISIYIIGFGIIVEFCMNYDSHKSNWQQQNRICTKNEEFLKQKEIECIKQPNRVSIKHEELVSIFGLIPICTVNKMESILYGGL